MATLLEPSIVPVNVNELAPLVISTLVTIYSKITMLPSVKAFPVTPSPKYISNFPSSTSCKK